MRFRIAIPILALGLSIAAGALWLRWRASGPDTPQPAISAPVESSADVPQRPTGPRAQTEPGTPKVTNASPADDSQARHETYVAQRVAELQDLAMDNAPASLDTILSELTNRDPEIRQAAREAAMQFGSRDAIPRLMEAAEQTDDVQEKASFKEAADFLKLPSPAELAASTGAGQTAPPLRLQTRPQGRNAGR